MQGLGYKEIAAYLEGEVTFEAAVAQLRRDTYRYAKRQMTWFRQEPVVEWFSGFGQDPQIQQAVLDRIGRFLVP